MPVSSESLALCLSSEVALPVSARIKVLELELFTVGDAVRLRKTRAIFQ